MKKISLTDIFTTSHRSSRTNIDRFTQRGISNTYLATTTLNTNLRSSRLENRIVSSTPFRILDAPNVYDDFYINILDWHTDNIYIGLGHSVYQYNCNTKKVNEIYASQNQNVTAVKANEKNVCIGLEDGQIVIMQDEIEVRKFMVDETRVGCIDIYGSCITIGTHNGNLANYDLNSGKVVSMISAHCGQLCGMKWSPDGRFLATGGNDKTVRVWKAGYNIARCSLKAHRSAVKAMAWCPWRTSILATGGGTNDKTIKEWDITTSTIENTIDVDSQISSLHYSGKYKELISSHGYSENNIVLRKSGNLKKICEFGKHEGRVLNTAINENGSELVSVGSDENLKFWKLYEEAPGNTKRNSLCFR